VALRQSLVVVLEQCARLVQSTCQLSRPLAHIAQHHAPDLAHEFVIVGNGCFDVGLVPGLIVPVAQHAMSYTLAVHGGQQEHVRRLYRFSPSDPVRVKVVDAQFMRAEALYSALIPAFGWAPNPAPG